MPRGVLSESAFTTQVRQLAQLNGWLWYHTQRSQFSAAGFPDCVLIRPPRVVYLELKAYSSRGVRGQPSPDQAEWLESLEACGVEWMLVWPEDIDAVAELLR
jgi:hypothetical protein